MFHMTRGISLAEKGLKKTCEVQLGRLLGYSSVLVAFVIGFCKVKYLDIDTRYLSVSIVLIYVTRVGRISYYICSYLGTNTSHNGLN